MSIFNNKTALMLAVLLLGACQSGLKKIPEPVIEASVEQPVAEISVHQQRYEKAVATLKSGDTARATELLARVSNDAPDQPYVFTNLGLAYFKLQQADLAEQAFKQAIARNNEDAVAHNHLGILERQQGQFEEARNRYQRAIEIDSKYASAYLNLGILFDIYLQDLEQALRQYQKYQTLISEEDSQVAGWIVDIQRRLKSTASKSEG